jgi:hypothetical protein
VSDASFHSAFREETDKPRMPKVMGNLALVLGTGAVLFGILGMGEWTGRTWIAVELAKMIAAGLFAWSGWMLVGYRARSIKIGVLSILMYIIAGVASSTLVNKAGTEKYDAAAGEYLMFWSLVGLTVQVVCCLVIIGLPWLKHRDALE